MACKTRTAKRRRHEPSVELEVASESSNDGVVDAPTGLVHNLDVTMGEDDDVMIVDEGSSDSDSDSGRSDDSRSEGELDEVAREMQELEKTTNLTGVFHLVDRLGTFSSVYKAVDLHHTLYDNTQWRPPGNRQLPTPDPSSDQPRKRKRAKVYVALKRIYVTSSPQRIQNELEILGKLRHCDNVAYLISAFRHEDQVIAVMPYEKHQDFRDYYRRADMNLLRNYFWCMLKGLEGAHELGIIHRDLKPANFLFNTNTGWGAVCDFGLAQTFNPAEWKGYCLHSLPLPQIGELHGRQIKLPLSGYDQVIAAKKEHKSEALHLDFNDDVMCLLEERTVDEGDFWATWAPASKPKTAQKIGYLKPELDKRPSAKANRAGTRGFRAPEVLFKCSDQTVSIDIWSVGITLLCFLTRRFPFFNSNDDTEALMEIACIFGKNKMEQCGALHNRIFQTNVPSVEGHGFRKNLHELVRALNPAIFKEQRPPGTSHDDFSWYDKSSLHQAIDLMKQCLALDCTRRVTAHAALQHPFFQADGWSPPKQAYSS